MFPKKKCFFNITLPVAFLFFYFLIFFVDLRGQTKSVDSIFNPSIPMKLCRAQRSTKTFDRIIASDNPNEFFVSNIDGEIESIELMDLQTNRKLWRSELVGKINSSFIVDQIDYKTLYFVTKLTSSTIWALNAETGITKWQMIIPSSLTGEIFLSLYQNALIVISRDGKVLSIDKSIGTINWIKSLNFVITSNPTFFEDQVLLSTADNKIFQIRLTDGKIFPLVDTPSVPNILLALSKKEFVWTDKFGRFFFRDKLKFRAGAEISNINVAPKGILVASNDNFLYFLSTDKQKILWRKKFAGRIFPKPLVVGNWAIVAVTGETELLIVDLANGNLINSLAIGEGNFFTDNFFIAFNKLYAPTIKGLFYSAYANAVCFN